MQKSKIFSKKLIALALAVLMAVSSFFGVASTAYAYQNGRYHDTDNTIGANALSWIEATDDATLEALLDTVDGLLADMDWDGVQKSVDAIGISSLLPAQVVNILDLQINLAFPSVSVSTSKIVTISINGSVDSVDGVIALMFQLKQAFSDLKGAGNLASMIGFNLDGILNGISFNTFGNYFKDSANSTREQGYRTSSGSWRDLNSARFILRGVIQWLLIDNRSLLDNLLAGDLSLVSSNDGELINVYDIIGGLVGIDYDAWKDASNGTAYNKSSNGVVYNILKAVLVKFVPYYENSDHLKEEGSNWVYDSELWKIANYYLNKLSFEITYPEYATFTAEDEIKYDEDIFNNTGETVYIGGRFNDSSKLRYKKAVAAGKFNASTGKIDSTYATAQGWDPNLVYSTEEGYEGNVLVSQYGNEKVTVTSSDTVYSVLWKALPIVWKTALKPTIELLHVNYNGRDGEGGTNFDNQYFYWVNEEYQNGNYTWVRGANYADNYSSTIVNAWASAVYADYGFTSAAKFLDHVKYTLTYDKTRLAKNDKYNWRDIDASILFNEIRYSPLADKYFNIQTGPLNLYFEQTGAPAVIAFFDGLFANKTAAGFPGSLMGQLDDALVTAMADLFPNSANIGKAVADGEGAYDGVDSTTMPALSTTSSTTVAAVVETLIGDAATVFKYAADATDANLLNPFYNSEFADDGEDTIITEQNIEQAVIPLAISALKHWNITASIHNADWDKVCDIESGAVVALQEYLKYAYPDRDYSDLYTLSDPMPMQANPDISYKFIEAIDGTTLLDHAIMPMAADALLFVLTAAGVPIFEQTSSTCSYSGSIIKPLEYTFKGKGDGLNNKFWQTANATICYFGATGGKDGAAKSIAFLANAPNAVTTSNTIWQNLNNTVNTLLPALSQLLGNSTAGSLDLQDLLWNKIVGSVADIGGNNGFTQIFTIVGNILTCSTLNSRTVFNAVIFDIAKPLINKLLGSRTNTAADIIRVTESTSNPLNTFLLETNINTSVDNLFDNLLQITNGTNATTAITDNSIHAAAYILMATHIIPRLRDNSVGGVSAELVDHVVSTTSFSTRLSIRNESWGINDMYNDYNNNVVEAGRYYATIKSVKIFNVSNGNDVTGSFSIAPARSKYSMPSGNTYVNLNPEELTRLKISGSGTAAGIYRVEVLYDMTRKDVLSHTSNDVTYSNVRAVDFFSATSSTSGDLAWTDAFSGDYASNNAELQAAGLVVKQTSGSLDLYGPTLIVAGSSAGSSGYGFNVENRQNQWDSDGNATSYTGTNAKLNYATVAANTTGYTLKSGSASSAANANAAWVAVDDEQNVIKGDGSTVAFATALASDGIGYIKNADDEYVALAVAASKIGTTSSTYRAGTPLRGVYLDTTQFHIDGRHDKNNQNGSAGNRIIAKDSLSGRPTEYNKMTINTTVGSFPLTIATGDIDSNYASLKSTAAGLAAHYFTASVQPVAVTSLIIPAMTKTLSSGVNLDNLDNALSVKDEVEALLDAAYNNRTTELNSVVNDVIKSRRERSNVNYVLVCNYEEAVKKAKSVEELIQIEYQWQMDGDEHAVDENGNWIPIYEDANERYQLANYLSYSPCIVLQEGARVFSDVYMAQARLRSTGVFQLLYDEITHATSSTDEYDVLDEEFTNENTNFGYIREEVPMHQFPYTTKDEGEWDKVYTYTVTGEYEKMPVKFGSVVYNEETGENELANLRYDEESGEYVQAYTYASWTAYVDALGECLEVADLMDGDPNKTVHNAYQARSHLVICENNLEIYDEEEDQPPVGDETITVSGKVTIADTADGDSGAMGIGGINIYVDTNEAPVATTAADGTFEAEVPVGTTELLITGFTYVNGNKDVTTGSTIDRTVTLAGDADVSGVEIPIIITDYNADRYVTAIDYTFFGTGMGSQRGDDEYNAFYDLNADGYITAMDYTFFASFMGNIDPSFEYPALELE